MARRRQGLLRRADGFRQARERQRLQRVELRAAGMGTEFELLQHGVGQARRALALGEAHAGAALDDRLVEQPLGARHPKQRADLSAAARLAEDGDIARIAAQAAGMLVHPLQRRHEIENARVSRRGEALVAGAREIEVAEDIEPVVDRDDDDIIAPREAAAVIPGRVGRPVGEGAAMQPDHDGTLRRVEARGPDVQRQAILADRQAVAHAPDRCQFRALRAGARLRRSAGIDDRVTDARPGFGLERRHEAIGTGCRGAIGNAFEDMQVARPDAAYLARRGLGRGRIFGPGAPTAEGRRGEGAQRGAHHGSAVRHGAPFPAGCRNTRPDRVAPQDCGQRSGRRGGPAYRVRSPSNWRMLSPALGSVRYMSPLRST